MIQKLALGFDAAQGQLLNHFRYIPEIASSTLSFCLLLFMNICYMLK
jgi:hypothetical protein